VALEHFRSLPEPELAPCQAAQPGPEVLEQCPQQEVTEQHAILTKY